jgi:hypothetical protein
MASSSLGRLNNLFIHLLDPVGVEKQTVRPAHNRTTTLTRATPGLIVAVLVWSLVFLLSVGTNGALAAALAKHLSIPPALADAFSSLTGERDAQSGKDLTHLVVLPPAPDSDHFQHSGLPPFAGNGSAFSSSIVAHGPMTSPIHGGLLGLDFMHALANDHAPYVASSAHPDAWTRGGAANPFGIAGPVRAGRIVRGGSNGTISDERSDDDQAPASQIPAPHVVGAPDANAPVIDPVPWAKSTPNTGPASRQAVDKLVTLDDNVPPWAHPPLDDDGLPPIEFVLEPHLAVDVARPAATLAATRVPGPGTLGLLAGAFLAWPIAKRMRIGSAPRTRSGRARSGM